MAATPTPRNFSDSTAADLRARISAGEWTNGDKLPGEHQLAETYQVSRATIRTALQDLESRGLTVTRRGVGTFVTGQVSGMRADMRELTSISETIRSHGRVPGVVYRSIAIRAASPEELASLQLVQGSEVLATDRALTADDETVAYSRDIIPVGLLGTTFSPSEVHGSLFDLLESHGVRANSTVTDIHAVHDPDLGWGERPDDPTYLLLSQLHFDRDGSPVALAHTYFVEGQISWSLLRHR